MKLFHLIIHNLALSWTHLRAVRNSNCLISLHHCYNKAANFELLSINSNRTLSKIFQFEQIDGDVGNGDIASNEKNNFVALIPVKTKITYHLFSVDMDSNNPVAFIRRTKWYPQHSSGKSLHSLLFKHNSSNSVFYTISLNYFQRTNRKSRFQPTRQTYSDD